MLSSLKYRILRPLIIKPPYSNLTRNFSKKFLNLNSRFLYSDLDDHLKNKILQIRENGCAHSTVNELGIKDSFENILNALSDLGFPSSGNIKDIKNQDLLKTLELKINNRNHKKFKLSIGNLIDQSLIEKISKSEYLNEVPKNYLGVEIKNTYIDILFDHNFSGDIETLETQNYHRDHNGILLLKIFIYLCDVKIENGPFAYIKKSHKKEFMKNFKIKPKIIRNNLRYDNSQVSKTFEDEEIVFQGNKGMVIFSDTTGLHRGYKPNINNFRILLSMTFEPKNSFLSFSEIK